MKKTSVMLFSRSLHSRFLRVLTPAILINCCCLNVISREIRNGKADHPDPITTLNKGRLKRGTLPKARHAFTVIAHRGDHENFPENTIAAIQKAIEDGADYVEIDLRTTKDSALVIMHDETVDRTTEGKGKVSEMTFSQIGQLKVRTQTDGRKNYAVPSFKEVLKLCRGKIYIYLDFKNASVRQSIALIRKYGMENQMIVYINKEAQVTEWRKWAPEMPLMFSLPDEITTPEALQNFIAQQPVELLDGDYANYTRAVLAAAEQLGIAVWPDIQGPGEMNNWDEAIETGFKGLQTDHPRQLIDYLRKKNLR